MGGFWGAGTKPESVVSKECMDLNRFRLLLAAPMAGLFLVLGLCTFVLQRPGAVGMVLPLPIVRTVPSNDCVSINRSIVVLLHKDGSTWINETQVPAYELHSKLAEIYENRKYKLIYLLSDPDVSFGMFAGFYGIVASSTNDLRIVLFTRSIQAQSEHCPAGSCCSLYWPNHTSVSDEFISIPELIKPIQLPR